MTVLNDLDRFHLVIDAVARLPRTGARGLDLTHQLTATLVAHKH